MRRMEAIPKLARRVFGDLSGTRVLVLGAGPTALLLAAQLAPARLACACIADEAPAAEGLAGFDIVIACSTSPAARIDASVVARALRLRKRRPLLLVDLASPPRIAPEVQALPDIFLYTKDELP